MGGGGLRERGGGGDGDVERVSGAQEPPEQGLDLR